MDMDDPAVDEWIAGSGLTKEECAMIQPQYGWQPQPTPPPNYNKIKTGYGLSSSILSGVNISLSAINCTQIGKGSNDFISPVIGIMGGASQILIGAVNMPTDIETIYGTQTNESQKHSLLSISDWERQR
jgi:NADH:ubiquinone oxidoreductase subunit F (NADH-binding)